MMHGQNHIENTCKTLYLISPISDKTSGKCVKKFTYAPKPSTGFAKPIFKNLTVTQYSFMKASSSEVYQISRTMYKVGKNFPLRPYVNTAFIPSILTKLTIT